MESKSKLHEIEQVLERLGGIPPIPAVACEVLRVAGLEDARLADIVRLIARDQGLATKVLRTCNSAYYGIPHKVKSLSRAVGLLGFMSVRNLVVIHSLPRKRSATPTFTETTIWAHSAAGGMVGRVLAEGTGRIDPEEAMLGGLIHDTGRQVLNILLPEHYEPIMRAIYNREGDSIELERKSLGLDHTQVGEAVLRKWNFPDELAHTVRHHHDPVETLDPLSLTVRGTDEMLYLLGYGVREEAAPGPELPPGLRALGVTPESYVSLEEKARTALEAGQELFAQL